MADDLKNNTQEDPSSLPAKRNPELECLDQAIDRKKMKPDNPDNQPPEITEVENKDDENENGVDGGVDEAPSNGESVVDRKGKGITREDKGKGKLIVEEEEEGSLDGDDDDDDSSDYVVDCSDDDSDFSNDPLAEVDLDNILPSRTRRRVSQPGAYLVNDLDGGDDDSDD